MQYTFRIPIGDWSDDGHGKCDWFTIISNKPVEEVREIHFQSKEVFDVERVCSDYEENTFHGSRPEWAEEFFDKGGYLIEGTEGLCQLWICTLMKTDLTLSLSISRDMPMLPFYGRDKERRHIPHVGYGLFW
jgi:hypothetical protein